MSFFLTITENLISQYDTVQKTRRNAPARKKKGLKRMNTYNNKI